MDQNQIEQEVLNAIKKNHLEKINDMYLTKYQQEVLQKNNIAYKNCKNLNELLFLLSEEYEDEELEEILSQIEEFHYYNETHK